MEYRVLGTLEVRADGEAVELGPPKQRTVLAILLLHAGEVVPTDRLIELAWGERAPRTAGHSLQIYVSELRKALEPRAGMPVIVTKPPGYSLEASDDLIDARRFQRLIALGSRELDAGNHSEAAASMREALGLWRGPPLSDFAYEEFAQDEIRRLEGLHVDALEALAGAELAMGREQDALTAIETAITEDPLRERCREIQMVALCRSGRRAAALRAYQAFQGLLRDELDIEPGRSLQRLQERVLLRDPDLGPTEVRGAASTVPLRNPYKGLRAFGEEDAGDFFGRELLVAELVEALARGRRLLALVGPSGCGKSSVLHAGLLPALRHEAVHGSDRWAIATMTPGEQPVEGLEAAVGGAAAPLPEDGRFLLVIDQFEELFAAGDDRATARFLGDLTAAVTDGGGRITVLLALRADFYDRPLLHPGFAPLFTEGVVNVVPMAPDDLEAAVVGPARRVGLDVEPALVAQLTTDTAGRPSALPLLQYALTELFDRRTGSVLTLEDYRALGGVREALSRRAEALYVGLAEDRRTVALQVLLRLARLVDGGGPARRRVPLRELTSLDLDPVALSEVLDEFGGHRLLSFDRDPTSGDATVEVAHEALLSEWPRLAGWIEQHRADLRQHESLAAAAAEWESSGRQPDYLLIGSRLQGYEAWAGGTVLRLGPRERALLEASMARRRAEEAEEAIRRDGQRRLERRARARLWALLAAITLLAAAATFGALTWLGSRPPEVALLVEGTGDAGFGDLAVAGIDRARTDLGLDIGVRAAKGGSAEVEAELRRLSDAGVPLIVVGIGAGATAPTAAVAANHPGTRYITWENYGDLPNATDLSFRSEEGAYLAGVAAALKSRTGIVGVITAFRDPIFDAYVAGFEAGARSGAPDIEVRARYLAEWSDFGTVGAPALAAQAASQLYDDGADVVFAVAGRSNLGVFRVAASASDAQGRQLWAIGADTDEYDSVLRSAPAVLPGVDPAPWQQHILTSVTKRLDVAFRTLLEEYVRGTLAPGQRSLGLAEGGVGISYSGGFIDDIRPKLDEIRAAIVSGEIAVPTVPTEPAAERAHRAVRA